VADKPFDGYADALARLAAKKALVAALSRDEVPDRTYIAYARPRPLSDWVIDGVVAEGFEASGRMFPNRVLDSPDEFVVVGEERYSDGRTFLDFGMKSSWIEAKSNWRFHPDRALNPVWVCPDCGGIGDEHHRIDMDGRLVKCPSAPSGYRWNR